MKKAQTNFNLTRKQMAVKFGKKIQRLRVQKSLSQKNIAEKLKIPLSTYANWEQGRREPPLYQLFNIVYILNINFNTLFDLD